MATELALLVPLLFLVFLAAVQVVIYLQSSTATQYAAFLAARAYQVHGSKTLSDIDYPHLSQSPKTNATQTISEAAAEKIIFESLLWEHKRISVAGDHDSDDRTYADGNDISLNGQQQETSQGAVRINIREGLGTDVTYCMPIHFPGADALFAATKEKYPCRTSRSGRTYNGVAITQRAAFGLEPPR